MAGKKHTARQSDGLASQQRHDITMNYFRVINRLQQAVQEKTDMIFGAPNINKKINQRLVMAGFGRNKRKFFQIIG
jgi:alkylated DNA nucleotide flippase Atl1